MSAVFDTLVTAEIVADKGLVFDSGLAEKELAEAKQVLVIIEASDDGREWWVEQSLVWQGPAEERPVIEPNVVKGRLYRMRIVADGAEYTPDVWAK